MVKPFQFARLPLISFGTGNITALPGIIKKYGNELLLVTGEKSFMNSGYGQSLVNSFKVTGIKYHHVIIPCEPSPDDIDQVVRRLSKETINVVAGIGGGSVLDAGKAISAMMYRTESVQDYLEGVGNKAHPGTKIPFIAIPTTSGTGSEATRNAVISRIGKDGFKRSLRHDNFVPDIALVDPDLTLNCPADITAASGMDCFTQLLEAYLSTKANEYTDALALEGLKAIKSSLKQACNNGQDIAARTGMSFAALTSGICLANAGLGVVHGFASSIGGLYNIPHGIICGTVMAGSNELNVKKIRKGYANPEAMKKYALLGKLFLDEKGKGEDFYSDGFIEYLRLLTDELHLPGLKKYGIRENDLEMICSITEIKNNPVNLETSDLMEILLERFI
jgi:alcohol dehydrogenase class IV